MTIADLIKYIDFLKERVSMLRNKVHQVEVVKISQRIVSTTDTSKVEEFTHPTISIDEITAEYDKTAKELRLAQQALERVNHTTEVGFSASY